MADLIFANDFVYDLGLKKHNMGADTFEFTLSNVLPSAEAPDPSADGGGVLANVTEIDLTNMSTSQVLASVAWTRNLGRAKFDFADLLIEATGGAIPTWRILWVYNATAAGSPLVGYFDMGTSVDISVGSPYPLTLSSNGMFHGEQIA